MFYEDIPLATSRQHGRQQDFPTRHKLHGETMPNMKLDYKQEKKQLKGKQSSTSR